MASPKEDLVTRATTDRESSKHFCLAVQKTVKNDMNENQYKADKQQHQSICR